jgi:hypothetical protein
MPAQDALGRGRVSVHRSEPAKRDRKSLRGSPQWRRCTGGRAECPFTHAERRLQRPRSR